MGGRYATDYYGGSVAVGLAARRQSRSPVIQNVRAFRRVSVRAVNRCISAGLIREISYDGKTIVVLMRRDGTRGVAGGRTVSTLALDLNQSRFTHRTQVLGVPTMLHEFALSPVPDMLLFRRCFHVG